LEKITYNEPEKTDERKKCMENGRTDILDLTETKLKNKGYKI
jgi:hypothetical protein